MILESLALIAGLALLFYSAERFVEGAARLARLMNMPPLLIGMVVVGFGTSAPELTVSAIAAWQGSAGIALGNAYGSNIANIALILGVAALVRPIGVHSAVLRRELPLLVVVTGLSAWLLSDGALSRIDSWLSLVLFAGIIGWSILQARTAPDDPFADAAGQAATGGHAESRPWPVLILGLAGMILASRAMVWGAVGLARALEMPEHVIGLTIVAVGTSLPELASSVSAARRGQSDLALGNVLGSNLFNTLAVAGLAGTIRPLDVPSGFFTRDLPVLGALTLALMVFCFGFNRPGRINRYEGGALLATYAAYLVWLIAGR